MTQDRHSDEEPSEGGSDDKEQPDVENGDQVKDSDNDGEVPTDESEIDSGDSLQSPVDLTMAIDLSGILKAFDFSSLMPSAGELSKLGVNLPKISDLLPKDWASQVFPALDMSGFVREIDFASFYPKIDLHLPTIDVSSILPKFDFGKSALAFLKRLRESLPPNWPQEIDLDEQVITVIQKDGIPLVWVPRAEILLAVLAAPDRDARVAVLLANASTISTDCRAVLRDVTAGSLAGQVPLAMKAIDAFDAGHHEAAQALAVVVTETAVARAISGKYEVVKKQVLFDPELVPFTQVRWRAALAPIGRFYTAWRHDSGQPPPEALSRHVTVHQADQGHYTAENAIVAVMLAASVLRALDELEAFAESSEDDGDAA